MKTISKLRSCRSKSQDRSHIASASGDQVKLKSKTREHVLPVGPDQPGRPLPTPFTPDDTHRILQSYPKINPGLLCLPPSIFSSSPASIRLCDSIECLKKMITRRYPPTLDWEYVRARLPVRGLHGPLYPDFNFQLFIGQHARRRSRKCCQPVNRHGLDGSRLDIFLIGRYYGALGDVPG